MSLPDLYNHFVGTMTSKEIFYDWEGLNDWLFNLIYAIRGVTYDNIMQYISDAARGRFFPFYLVAFIAYSVLAYLLMKLRDKGGTKQFVSLWVGVLTVMVIGFLINWALINFLKDYFQYPRPYVALEHVQALDKTLNTVGDAHTSMPSGHVAFMTLMVISLWPAMSGRARLAGLFVVALIAWSRIALAAHFPADAFYGFLITAIMIVILREIVYSLYYKILGMRC